MRTPTPPKKTDEESSLLSHLEALRHTLLRSLAAAGLLFPVCWFAAPHLIRLLLQWIAVYCPRLPKLYYFSPMEAFLAEMKMGAILALFAAYPYIAFQVWKFLVPALYERERRGLRFALVVASGLFLLGATFCALVLLPLIVRFALSFEQENLQAMFGFAAFLNLAGWLMLAFGLVFQMPLAVYLLVRFGVVRTQTLVNGRPYIVIGLLVLAAFLTPPDVISQILLFLPAWLLFELGVLFAKRAGKTTQDGGPSEDTAERFSFAGRPRDKTHPEENPADPTLEHFYEERRKQAESEFSPNNANEDKIHHE